MLLAYARPSLTSMTVSPPSVALASRPSVVLCVDTSGPPTAALSDSENLDNSYMRTSEHTRNRERHLNTTNFPRKHGHSNGQAKHAQVPPKPSSVPGPFKSNFSIHQWYTQCICVARNPRDPVQMASSSKKSKTSSNVFCFCRKDGKTGPFDNPGLALRPVVLPDDAKPPLTQLVGGGEDVVRSLFVHVTVHEGMSGVWR